MLRIFIIRKAFFSSNNMYIVSLLFLSLDGMSRKMFIQNHLHLLEGKFLFEEISHYLRNTAVSNLNGFTLNPFLCQLLLVPAMSLHQAWPPLQLALQNLPALNHTPSNWFLWLTPTEVCTFLSREAMFDTSDKKKKRGGREDKSYILMLGEWEHLIPASRQLYACFLPHMLSHIIPFHCAALENTWYHRKNETKSLQSGFRLI